MAGNPVGNRIGFANNGEGDTSSRCFSEHWVGSAAAIRVVCKGWAVDG